jgi:phage head maturation protease
MKNEKIERRSSSFSASGRTIEGYAIVFDTQSELIADRFYEVIKPDAISMAIVDQSDVFATLNHSQDRGIL